MCVTSHEGEVSYQTAEDPKKVANLDGSRGYGEGCSVDEIPGISGVLNDGEKTNEDVGPCGAQVEDQDVVAKVDSEIRARYGRGIIFEADDLPLEGRMLLLRLLVVLHG